MNRELAEIIEFYEEEQQRLASLIQLAIEEREFKMAHHHQKAFDEVGTKLFRFRNFANPNFGQIESLRELRQLYDKPLGLQLSDYFARKRQEIDRQLTALTQQALPPSIDGQEFDDLIFDMVEGRMHKFRFFLDPAEKNLYLDFEKIGNQLVIAIPRFKKLKKKHILDKSSVKVLKGLGFAKTDDKKSLLLNFDLHNFRDAIAIKTLTSRILYDAIGYSLLSKLTFLQIIA